MFTLGHSFVVVLVEWGILLEDLQEVYDLRCYSEGTQAWLWRILVLSVEQNFEVEVLCIVFNGLEYPQTKLEKSECSSGKKFNQKLSRMASLLREFIALYLPDQRLEITPSDLLVLLTTLRLTTLGSSK